MKKYWGFFLYSILFSILLIMLIIKLLVKHDYQLSILWFDHSVLSEESLIENLIKIPSIKKKEIYILVLDNNISIEEINRLKKKFKDKKIIANIQKLSELQSQYPESLSLKTALTYPNLTVKRNLSRWFIPRNQLKLNIICTEKGLLSLKDFFPFILSKYPDNYMADLIEDQDGFYEQQFNIIIESQKSKKHVEAIKLIEYSFKTNQDRIKFINKKNSSFNLNLNDLVHEKLFFLKAHQDQIISDFYFFDSLAGADFAHKNSFLFNSHFNNKFISEYDFSRKINYKSMSYNELESVGMSHIDLFLKEVIVGDFKIL